MGPLSRGAQYPMSDRTFRRTMHKSLLALLLALLLTPLASLPLWIGDSTDLEPLQRAVQPSETSTPIALAALTGPALIEELTSDALFQLSVPAVAVARTHVDKSAPLELAREPGHLPTGLLLDVAASEEEFAAHYAGLPIEELVRQVYRIDQVVSAKLDAPPVEDPLKRVRLLELSTETDALLHERKWLNGALQAYTRAEDNGAPVPTPVSLERFVERHRDKDMEDLHVLQVQVQRSHKLLHRRAIDALFDEGSYTVDKGGPNL